MEALYLENLGDVLLDQRRYREATEVFAASTKILPEHADGYHGIAEVLLRQDRDAERALQLVDKAIQLKESNPRTRNIDRHN
jgi:cytochrome c-type biogenesis protein CcmH/NrfG